MTAPRRIAAAVAMTLALTACDVEERVDPGPPSYRAVSATRAMTDESRVSVHVRFGVGKFNLTPVEGMLYRANLNYDERRFSPVMEYDAEDGDLDIGIKGRHMGGNMSLDEQRLDLALGTGVPLGISLELGAAESTMELGGLTLKEFDLTTGASKTTARFSTPNLTTCNDFSVQAGAAELVLSGLANSRCGTFEFTGGAGEFTFDFTGSWGDVTNVDMEIKMGVGEMKLVFPDGMGVAIEMDKFLVGFEGSRFRQEGRRRYSDNYETANVRMTVRVSAALGSLNVRWVKTQE